MQIDRIILRDVGPFTDVTISLPPGQDPKLADVYLLTGPNGSGKSTILYALATLIGAGYGLLGESFLARRFRNTTAMAGFAAGEGRRVATFHTGQSMLADPFGGPELRSVRNTGDALTIYSNHIATDYGVCASRSDNTALTEPFSWAAFAYAGGRTLERGTVSSIQEIKESPFTRSLSFEDSANTTQLASWIVSQQFKLLKAKDAGRDERVAQLGQSIRETERLIGNIVDDPDFRLITADEDNDVRVHWHGRTVDLDLLPDGLKSIMSWVADLLMRLDRIPWTDNIPALQRAFLLLLDEVDIHLHPAWQRKVLPFVQQMFPNAQIIATTHSPFVVASAADAHIVTFAFQGGVSTVEHVAPSQIGVSYSAVLRSIFGIDSEFDVATEEDFRRFHDAKTRLLAREPGASEEEVQRVAAELASRSEEVRELVALELAQLKRQLARSPQ